MTPSPSPSPGRPSPPPRVILSRLTQLPVKGGQWGGARPQEHCWVGDTGLGRCGAEGTLHERPPAQAGLGLEEEPWGQPHESLSVLSHSDLLPETQFPQ